ncbi:MAG: cysteine peptidase family C39 domain-containing protein [bacterium]|nr:cysteine peptidase family C39 domain-containing protein [bacterium]
MDEQKQLTPETQPEPQKNMGDLIVTHYKQTGEGYCGPAALKTLLSYFGKTFSEEQLAAFGYTTREDGTEHEGLIQTAKEVGGYVFTKNKGTLEELEYFLKEEKLPVVVGWFDETGDHYCVVVNITDKNIILVDPDNTKQPERWIPREIFPNIWFDFTGPDNRSVDWGWYMVLTFEKKKFKVKGGYYY